MEHGKLFARFIPIPFGWEKSDAHTGNWRRKECAKSVGVFENLEGVFCQLRRQASTLLKHSLPAC